MIVIASDHRGVALKADIKLLLENQGIDVLDTGTYNEESVDYPIIAQTLARTIAGGQAEQGILICGSGIGVCIAANRFQGIRAATCRSVSDAEMTRRHNDANVVCIGADVTPRMLAFEIVETFHETEFEGGRHKRRVDMIEMI